MMDKWLIVAGNKSEAEYWAKSNHIPRSKWKYASSAIAIRGITGFKIVYIGTWHRHRDIEEIRELISEALFAHHVEMVSYETVYPAFGGI